jgi:hypothetical protein
MIFTLLADNFNPPSAATTEQTDARLMHATYNNGFFLVYF